MGTLSYDHCGEPISIDDRTLAHLKAVIATKLRRQEAFTLSWKHPAGEPSGRSTIWLHPSIPLRFTFDDPEPEALNMQWIERLMRSVNSSGGVMLVDEVTEAPAD